jgi:hypothetical protein
MIEMMLNQKKMSERPQLEWPTLTLYFGTILLFSALDSMHAEPSTLQLILLEYRTAKATTTLVLDLLNRLLRLTSRTEKHVGFYSIEAVRFESGTGAAELFTYGYVLFVVFNNFHSYLSAEQRRSYKL